MTSVCMLTRTDPLYFSVHLREKKKGECWETESEKDEGARREVEKEREKSRSRQ